MLSRWCRIRIVKCSDVVLLAVLIGLLYFLYRLGNSGNKTKIVYVRQEKSFLLPNPDPDQTTVYPLVSDSADTALVYTQSVGAGSVARIRAITGLSLANPTEGIAYDSGYSYSEPVILSSPNGAISVSPFSNSCTTCTVSLMPTCNFYSGKRFQVYSDNLSPAIGVNAYLDSSSPLNLFVSIDAQETLAHNGDDFFKFATTGEESVGILYYFGDLENAGPDDFRVYYAPTPGATPVFAQTTGEPAATWKNWRGMSALSGNRYIIIDCLSATPNVILYELQGTGSTRQLVPIMQWSGLTGLTDQITFSFFYYRQAVWYDAEGLLGVMYQASDSTIRVNFYAANQNTPFNTPPFVVGSLNAFGPVEDNTNPASLSTSSPPRATVVETVDSLYNSPVQYTEFAIKYV